MHLAKLKKGSEATKKKYQEDPEYRAKMSINLAKGRVARHSDPPIPSSTTTVVGPDD